MIIRIEQDKWYINKKGFIKLYRDLGYRWISDSSKWVSPGGSSYLLKLEMDGIFKRFFIKDCSALANFILNIGGVEETDKVVVSDKIKEYHFIGADLWSWYRLNEILESCPDDLGIVWK